VKSKYFFIAALAVEDNQPRSAGLSSRAAAHGVGFVAVRPLGGRDAGRCRRHASRAPAGGFDYQVYVGPLEYRRLSHLGHDLDDANPYGGFLQPIIQPVSVLVVNILIWMHDQLKLAYGWVLIIFGILVRLLLWPLNQRAMESSIRMQAVAPLLKQIQDRYKNEPERLQREMMKLYKSTTSTRSAAAFRCCCRCGAVRIFFVFANTSSFGGVPFLWLPDLSRADPYYIIPS